MATTGAPWNLPSPALTDVPDAPAAIASLATSVHNLLGQAYPCTSTTRPAVEDGLIIYETDTQNLYIGRGGAWASQAYGDDPGPVDAATAGVTQGSAFTMTGGNIQRRNGLVAMYLSMTSVGVITAGNIANQLVVTVPAAYIPRMSHGQFSGGANGPSWNGYVNSSGQVYMTTLDTNLTAGMGFNLNGLWML